MWRPSMSLKNKRSKFSGVKASSSLKRRRKGSVSEDEDIKGSKMLKEVQPISRIYNSSFRNAKPAELFRKDLISAMKMADSDQLCPEDYWLMTDTWKEEWERGVQVPVNPEILPDSEVRIIRPEINEDFKLPKKFLHNAQDDNFSAELHIISAASTVADKACRYDLDDVDTQWLKLLNEERDDMGLPTVEEVTMEIVIEDLEVQCFENLQEAIKNQEGLGIEYDEDVICDVCRSPDSEDGNEMVFCDSCNICVHQACYGITAIPDGSWVCRTCALGIRPSCVLCPNKGGAMKSTRSGNKWAHVSCALWVPEVSIGCVDKMEPITKISQIPPSRWSLLCSICKERIGSCIQCSVKTCKTAYHVTCAFKHGLEMKAIIDEESEEDGVKLRSYCEKHGKKTDTYSSDSEMEEKDDKLKQDRAWKELEMTTDDKAGAREKRIEHVKSEFFKHVSTKQASETLQVDALVVDFIYQYWKLKRKANLDKPLLTPKAEESDALSRQQEDSLYARMKMFVHLRQDLERVRNLCYMVGRREKISRSLFKIREEVFKKQMAIISQKGAKLTEKDRHAVIQANHGDNIYDRLYSMDSERFPLPSAIISVLEGKESPLNDLQSMKRFVRKPEKPVVVSCNVEKICEGVQRAANPYAKHYFNGIRRSHRRFSSLFELEGGKDILEDSFSGIKKEPNEACNISDGNNHFENVKIENFKFNNGDNKMLIIDGSSTFSKLEYNNDSDTCSFKDDEICASETQRLELENKGLTDRTDFDDKTITLDNINALRKVLQAKRQNNVCGLSIIDGDLPVEVKLLNELKATISMNEILSNVGKENDENVISSCKNEDNEPKYTTKTQFDCQNDKNETFLNYEHGSENFGEMQSNSVEKPEKMIEFQNTDSDTSVVSTRRLRSGRESVRCNSSSDEISTSKPPTVVRLTKAKQSPQDKSKLLNSKAGSESLKSEPRKDESHAKAPKIFPRTCLVGYRIPKKKNESSDSENAKDLRGNSPLSPLSEIVSKPECTVLYNQKPVRHIIAAQPLLTQQVSPQQNSWPQVNHAENQSPRLVIKLRKDPDSPRWRNDAYNSLETSPEMSFHVIQNDWEMRNNRKSERQRNSTTSDSAYSDNDIGNRYPIRFRSVTHKPPKQEYAS